MEAIDLAAKTVSYRGRDRVFTHMGSSGQETAAVLIGAIDWSERAIGLNVANLILHFIRREAIENRATD